ncbi:MAG TPA: sulfite exporter TauE/SafE family protein [Solirubrobacteraceae bacterium]|nr:sulfite exporter TauE/SafE family protein [Solirubrobacteraceae bacterium]
MSVLEAGAIFAAGILAGTINTVVGSGTLITFPVLLAFGYRPVTANVSNTIGLVPGSVAGAVGYRAELRGQGRRTARLAIASVCGGILGAVLLLTLPASAFRAIVPAFIALALALIVFQPRIGAALAARRAQTGRSLRHPDGGPATFVGVFVAGIYGGYFGAAQGIMLLAILGLSLSDSLQRVNAVKVVLAGLVNLVAGLLFVVAAHVAWGPVVLIAAGSTLGGALGARVGRRLSPRVLRVVIVVVGVAAIVRLL